MTSGAENVVMPPAVIFDEVSVRPSLTKLCLTVPTPISKSLPARKMPKPSSSLMTAPTPIAWNSCIAASVPRWPALWISLAATDSGNGRPGSSTITRRRIVTNMIPRMPPRIISAAESRYSSHMCAGSNVQSLRMTNAGMVKIAPAATDSPIEPTVRAKFSSSTLPLNRRSTAIPMTAAG